MLTLQATRDAYEKNFSRAVIVASDGDYACLIKFLQKNDLVETIVSPAIPKKCSILLKRTNVPITYLNDQRRILESPLKEKAPDGNKTP